MLPASSPLKCVSPADVYLLLKSSDFILHDIEKDQLFQQCDGDTETPEYELELVLRKWYPVDRSRELRCFVRRETLLGGSIFYQILIVVLYFLQAYRSATLITTISGTNLLLKIKYFPPSKPSGQKISKASGKNPREIVRVLVPPHRTFN